MRYVALLVFGVGLFAGGVAVADSAPNDPAEGFNRKMFAVNQKLQDVERPIANVYNKHIPRDFRAGIHNFLHNLEDEPVTLANCFAQGHFGCVARTSGRIIANSVLGMGGIGDVAANMGLKAEDTDFDQTLCQYGAGQGAYLVIPVLGSSSVRGAVGTAVDTVTEPINYAHWQGKTPLDIGLYSATAMDEISHVGELDDIERTSVDAYAAMRSIYLQHTDCAQQKTPADL